MENKVQRMEELFEKSMDTVTSHPAFLNGVSVLLNFNSYRKIWFRKTMEAVWKDLELPIRGDQDKLLNSVEELNVRIKKLEIELQKERLKKEPEIKRSAKKVENGISSEVGFQ